mmetsp:Transcript_292/g.317  ORF Transcript_292/g.317 Transcript_292/m.317 type:complete len:82 (-) Transcript_292:119-364(-)
MIPSSNGRNEKTFAVVREDICRRSPPRMENKVFVLLLLSRFFFFLLLLIFVKRWEGRSTTGDDEMVMMEAQLIPFRRNRNK